MPTYGEVYLVFSDEFGPQYSLTEQMHKKLMDPIKSDLKVSRFFLAMADTPSNFKIYYMWALIIRVFEG